MSLNPATLARDRESCTTEERTVRALEMIADQLALIHAGLDGGQRAEGPGTATGKQSAEVTSDPDVTSFVETRYAVGAYRYNELEHAIAQARRARSESAAAAPLSQAMQ